MQGDLKPRYFVYPSLHYYLLGGVLAARNGDILDQKGAQWSHELAFHAQRVRLRDSAHARAACESALARLSNHLLPGLALSQFGTSVRLVLDPRLPDLPWELLPTDDGRPLAA